jgi:hypothetical protein
MFNQKVNHFIKQQPLPSSFPVETDSRNINNCRNTANKYTLSEFCKDLPLQTWCSPHVAVEMFAMRPITNSKTYFENIREYLASLVLEDLNDLNTSGLNKESYYLYNEDQDNSYIETLKTDVIDKINVIMANSCNMPMFKNYNPINEGFVVTDIDLVPYVSNTNNSHLFYNVLFSAFNTTRYNTVSFKATVYQDATPIVDAWNNAIQQLKATGKANKSNDITHIYINSIDLLNNTECIEKDCTVAGYSTKEYHEIKQQPVSNKWLAVNSLENNTYNLTGDYNPTGEVNIVDDGPPNVDLLIHNLRDTIIRTNTYL